MNRSRRPASTASWVVLSTSLKTERIENVITGVKNAKQ